MTNTLFVIIFIIHTLSPYRLVGSSLNSVDMESLRSAHGVNVYPLAETIRGIEQRMKMFDAHYIEEAQKQLSMLKKDLEILEKDKSRSSELLKAASSIADFKTKVESVLSVSDCLPGIVQRFKSLECIHQASGRAARRLHGT